MMTAHWVDEPESNFAAIVIVDEESGDTFEIQRAYEYDDQDRALGMDTYCLVRGGAAHYGGLLSYDVSGTRIRLSLTTPAAAALELPESFEIPLGGSSVTLMRMRLPGLLA